MGVSDQTALTKAAVYIYRAVVQSFLDNCVDIKEVFIRAIKAKDDLALLSVFECCTSVRARHNSACAMLYCAVVMRRGVAKTNVLPERCANVHVNDANGILPLH